MEERKEKGRMKERRKEEGGNERMNKWKRSEQI